MKFPVPKSDIVFDIPDDWWAFAELGRNPVGSAYYPYWPIEGEAISVVPIESVRPPLRNSGVPPFKKYKLMPVLFAFTSPECALPPVDVHHAAPGGPYDFDVANGYHRYYASCAVGYSRLPVRVVEKF